MHISALPCLLNRINEEKRVQLHFIMHLFCTLHYCSTMRVTKALAERCTRHGCSGPIDKLAKKCIKKIFELIEQSALSLTNNDSLSPPAESAPT